MTQIMRSITEIARCYMQYRAEKLAPYDLKGCHYSYLSEICQCPGISQDKLAQRIFINKSNVARQAVILEEGGFITRTSSQADKRVMELYPTEKTLAIMPELKRTVEQWEDGISADLTPEDIAKMTAILNQVKQKAAESLDCGEG